MEQKLLSAAIHNREAFEELKSLDSFGDFSDRGQLVLNEVAEYYARDDKATYVDKDVLSSKLERKFPKHSELFKHLIASLEEVSVPNIVNEVIELRKDAIRLRLSAAFANNKTEEIEELIEQYNKYNKGEIGTNEKAGELYKGVSVSDLVARTTGENRIKILPKALNDQLDGGALRQHHVIVFARPEMGKSLFVLNMAYGFLKQGLTVLYIGNEDPAGDMLLRLLCRITGMNKYEIRDNPDKADKLARERSYENFIFYELSPGTLRDIRGLMEEYQPDVVIIDQVRNLNINETNRVIQLEKAATGIRNLGKEFNSLMVSVTQAGESASGRSILSLGDVDFSNTGLQAQADLMIGIGATQDLEQQGLRMLSFPKNKISGIKDPVQVYFDPILTKVE